MRSCITTRHSKQRQLMRWIAAILSLLFLLFVALQWNDPDPLVWVTVYGLTAVLWLWRWWAPPPWWLTLPFLLLLLIWWLSLLPAVIDWLRLGAPSLLGSMKAESPHIELVREWGGLLLVMVALLPLMPRRNATPAP